MRRKLLALLIAAGLAGCATGKPRYDAWGVCQTCGPSARDVLIGVGIVVVGTAVVICVAKLTAADQG